MEGAVADGAAEKAPAPSLAEIRGTETILLAEDHESIREMARQTLANLGYRVLSAANGEEALRLCEHETPALAILGVIMPKMGGAAAAGRLPRRFPEPRIMFRNRESSEAEKTPA